ncbi:cytochrome bd-I ubiquinol oxidase subunit 2 apoprotein [Lampropedia hyalina DSM 16112]|jgi:cytochrome d ubiquinol oxidase subunit II|uniref:Cytochrome bd-I ubiquinol oxidase subunit 2 apoprotein n=1 Tax=Lampropedia hyalina DSM 16112 TaxID=1122156 RepID=A0A1M4ZQR4_9BURK|nr:cytochrome d ubiquinol oxidase subunit II [Lampropedia hyalina]SHF20430.1 cytochrome bd-I ubiquinol oxidase subunit 2 apoprotein [Lampropedia hyalina DSM 16112]
MILHELLNYDVLRVIWWLLLGILLVGFAVTDGFDLGVGTLGPFVARTDVERRVVLNTTGPIWEGNQVWLILGGGAIFAAWPQLYAVSFSGFYLAMFAILFALILRPVGFKYRSKIDNPTWRSTWDWCLFIGGFVPSLIFGVAIGNVLQGVPFRLEPDMQIYYDGTFFGLLNPFAVLCGLVSVSMLVAHGAAWLQLKTTGAVQARSRSAGTVAALLTPALYILAGILMWLFVDGYRITSEVVTTGPSNPLMKTATGGVEQLWFANYQAAPVLWLVPTVGVLASLVAAWGFTQRRELLTLLSNGVGIAGIILSVGVSMFPFILPSSVQPNASLTVWDSSSSHLILFIMLVGSLIFIPIILAYTSWVYSVMRGKVRPEEIEAERGHAY